MAKSLDRLIAQAKKAQEERARSYREQALKILPWICGRCAREFTRERLRELTVPRERARALRGCEGGVRPQNQVPGKNRGSDPMAKHRRAAHGARTKDLLASRVIH